jgi:predicted acetyltransferase
MNEDDVDLVDAWRVHEVQTFFRNVWPMYVHEMSGFDTDFYRLDRFGKWLPDVVEDWLAPQTPEANLRATAGAGTPEPAQRCHVIVAGDVPVGFVCLGLAPFRYMPPSADVILAELFLANPFRGAGIAQRALIGLLPRYCGRWHLRAVHDNTRAITFWRKTLPSLPIHELAESPEGREICWSFVVTSTK